ncbi:hypothetical protein ACK6D9_06225 [Hoeflea sp. Naph1]|uniref:hypothetical protein n=1 Tax=Hoeflea sp. Naph1 TaxID=3388653 RepID=UPI0039900850
MVALQEIAVHGIAVEWLAFANELPDQGPVFGFRCAELNNIPVRVAGLVSKDMGTHKFLVFVRFPNHTDYEMVYNPKSYLTAIAPNHHINNCFCSVIHNTFFAAQQNLIRFLNYLWRKEGEFISASGISIARPAAED